MGGYACKNAFKALIPALLLSAPVRASETTISEADEKLTVESESSYWTEPGYYEDLWCYEQWAAFPGTEVVTNAQFCMWTEYDGGAGTLAVLKDPQGNDAASNWGEGYWSTLAEAYIQSHPASGNYGEWNAVGYHYLSVYYMSSACFAFSIESTEFEYCLPNQGSDLDWIHVDTSYPSSPAPVMPPAPVISGAQELWHFNGMSPPEYATSIVLTSSGGNYTQWSITAGSGKVSLSASSGSSITVTSNSASAMADDVEITATNATSSDTHDLTVRAPYALEPGNIDITCPHAIWGHYTLIEYTVIDQFLTPLPNAIRVNEAWTSSVSNLWPGANGIRGDPYGNLIGSSTFVDEIGAADPPPFSPVPTIQCSDPAPVQSWGQRWFVGGTSPGQGMPVQDNTFLKMRGSTIHLSIVSPP